MASVLPQTASLSQGIHLPALPPLYEAEEFQLPGLIEHAGPVRELIEQRQKSGADRNDEVWDGVYHMSPIANLAHQRIVRALNFAFENILLGTAAEILAGANISDRPRAWYKNFRIPDLIVVLPGNAIQDRKTHYLGGPDLAVEVLSPDDDSVEKLPFYAKVGTREVLHVDTDTKAVSLYALRDGTLQVVGTSSIADSNVVASSVLPVSFQVLGDQAKPVLRVTHTAKPEQNWII